MVRICTTPCIRGRCYFFCNCSSTYCHFCVRRNRCRIEESLGIIVVFIYFLRSITLLSDKSCRIIREVLCQRAFKVSWQFHGTTIDNHLDGLLTITINFRSCITDPSCSIGNSCCMLTRQSQNMVSYLYRPRLIGHATKEQQGQHQGYMSDLYLHSYILLLTSHHHCSVNFSVSTFRSVSEMVNV